MAEKRKLLNEIEKCFKKIDEGVEEFEAIMQKMHEANSDNQREKCQDDLKKEIKKLQRLRDQIKGWQNSSEIKDKDKLIQYRKIIEHRMEQFKDIERENKTKPHSKQGLCAEEKLDPREKEKFETNEWLRTQIKHLEEEKDKAEALVETLASSESGGRRKGKKGDNAKNKENDKRIEELKHQIERISFHISNLEVCMRLVDNDTLQSSTVMESLKDAMETYIESFDPDSDMTPTENDPEDIYEEFNLSAFATQLSGLTVGTGEDDKCSVTENGLGSPTPMPKELDESKQRHSSGSSASNRDRPVPSTPLKLANLKQRQFFKLCQASGESSSLSSPPPQTPPPPPPGIPYNCVAAGKVHSDNAPPSVPASTASSEASIPAQTPPASKPSLIAQASSSIPDVPSSSEVFDSPEPSEIEPPKPRAVLRSTTAPAEVLLACVPPSTAPSEAVVPPPALVLPMGSSNAPASSSIPDVPSSSEVFDSREPSEIDQATLRNVLRSTTEPVNNEPKTAHIPSWLGASPLGRAAHQPEQDQCLHMLEHAHQRMPYAMDAEKPRAYLPKMPCMVPNYYPQTPPTNADTMEYYLRLSPETLFFAFYYMEGSRAQLLAAKALKKLSWRFHTKFLMWFQRHEEPKAITDDYEQGTYVYFDYEKWAQRKKESFTFEYRYLEDKDFD
ncbi:hypothetical protein QR680_013871 [Steinernema hermaphroditum]|uniref:NOT2/NOT3/NOT5 C-terminal domain-containing protein n=1 Tax=Steinernema hermaphroditum TaxID=289476 RepID=A0AA39I6Z3_9BILA|nr:hypothetical protein QR680_013871 [Steinernema hermaphroditum]